MSSINGRHGQQTTLPSPPVFVKSKKKFKKFFLLWSVATLKAKSSVSGSWNLLICLKILLYLLSMLEVNLSLSVASRRLSLAESRRLNKSSKNYQKITFFFVDVATPVCLLKSSSSLFFVIIFSKLYTKGFYVSLELKKVKFFKKNTDDFSLWISLISVSSSSSSSLLGL